jgi:chemotaxis protein MotC
METIVAIPDDKLSVKDRALKEAARAVAEEVLRAPVASVRKSDPVVTTVPEGEDASYDSLDAAETAARPTETPMDEATVAEPEKDAKVEKERAGVDPAFDSFVSGGRSKLDEIDKLLEGEGT